MNSQHNRSSGSFVHGNARDVCWALAIALPLVSSRVSSVECPPLAMVSVHSDFAVVSSRPLSHSGSCLDCTTQTLPVALPHLPQDRSRHRGSVHSCCRGGTIQVSDSTDVTLDFGCKVSRQSGADPA